MTRASVDFWALTTLVKFIIRLSVGNPKFFWAPVLLHPVMMNLDTHAKNIFLLSGP